MQITSISCEKLSYFIKSTPIFQNLTFTIPSQSITCILGPNGSGKTTLLKSILGLIKYQGQILFHTQDKTLNNSTLSPSNRSKLISYVPQLHHLHFPFTLLEIVMMGSFTHSYKMFYTQKDKDKALEVLSQLQISHLSQKPYPTLSGGEKQLGLIARAILQDTPIFILDEPVSALDISHSFKLLELLQSLKNKTIILTSHHPDQCFIATHILMLKDKGLLLYDTPQNALQEQYINALYQTNLCKVELPNGGKYFYPAP